MQTEHLAPSTFQNHLKQQTLLDHFLLTRQPTPVSTLPPRDEEPGSQSIIAQTGAERSLGASDLPELSLMEDVNDRIYVGSLSGVSSTQSVVDVDTGAFPRYPPFLP